MGTLDARPTFQRLQQIRVQEAGSKAVKQVLAELDARIELDRRFRSELKSLLSRLEMAITDTPSAALLEPLVAPLCSHCGVVRR